MVNLSPKMSPFNFLPQKDHCATPQNPPFEPKTTIKWVIFWAVGLFGCCITIRPKELYITCTVQPTKPQQKVEQWEKYSDFRPRNPVARICKPPFFERSNAGVWAKSGRSKKNPFFWGPVRPQSPYRARNASAASTTSDAPS